MPVYKPSPWILFPFASSWVGRGWARKSVPINETCREGCGGALGKMKKRGLGEHPFLCIRLFLLAGLLSHDNRKLWHPPGAGKGDAVNMMDAPDLSGVERANVTSPTASRSCCTHPGTMCIQVRGQEMSLWVEAHADLVLSFLQPNTVLIQIVTQLISYLSIALHPSKYFPLLHFILPTILGRDNATTSIPYFTNIETRV